MTSRSSCSPLVLVAQFLSSLAVVLFSQLVARTSSVVLNSAATTTQRFLLNSSADGLVVDPMNSLETKTFTTTAIATGEVNMTPFNVTMHFPPCSTTSSSTSSSFVFTRGQAKDVRVAMNEFLLKELMQVFGPPERGNMVGLDIKMDRWTIWRKSDDEEKLTLSLLGGEELKDGATSEGVYVTVHLSARAKFRAFDSAPATEVVSHVQSLVLDLKGDDFLDVLKTEAIQSGRVDLCQGSTVLDGQLILVQGQDFFSGMVAEEHNEVLPATVVITTQLASSVPNIVTTTAAPGIENVTPSVTPSVGGGTSSSALPPFLSQSEISSASSTFPAPRYNLPENLPSILGGMAAMLAVLISVSAIFLKRKLDENERRINVRRDKKKSLSIASSISSLVVLPGGCGDGGPEAHKQQNDETTTGDYIKDLAALEDADVATPPSSPRFRFVDVPSAERWELYHSGEPQNKEGTEAVKIGRTDAPLTHVEVGVLSDNGRQSPTSPLSPPSVGKNSRQRNEDSECLEVQAWPRTRSLDVRELIQHGLNRDDADCDSSSEKEEKDFKAKCDWTQQNQDLESDSSLLGEHILQVGDDVVGQHLGILFSSDDSSAREGNLKDDVDLRHHTNKANKGFPFRLQPGPKSMCEHGWSEVSPDAVDQFPDVAAGMENDTYCHWGQKAMFRSWEEEVVLDALHRGSISFDYTDSSRGYDGEGDDEYDLKSVWGSSASSESFDIFRHSKRRPVLSDPRAASSSGDVRNGACIGAGDGNTRNGDGEI